MLDTDKKRVRVRIWDRVSVRVRFDKKGDRVRVWDRDRDRVRFRVS